MNDPQIVVDSRWHPFANDGLITTVLFGVIASAALFGVYGLVAGVDAKFWAVLAVAATAFAGGLLFILRRVAVVSQWVFYLVLGGGSLVMTAFVVSVDADPLHFAIAYAVIAAIVGSMFPRPGQLVLQPVNAGSFLLALLIQGHELSATILPVGLLLATAYAAESFANGMQHAIGQEANAAKDAQLRSSLLRAAVDIHDLDIEQAAEAAVATLADLGFDIATFAVVDQELGEIRPVASTGLQEEIRSEPIALGRGLAGQAVASATTVEVEDYHQFAGRLPGRDAVRSGIAVPVVVAGVPRAVLQGGRRTPGRCTRAERELIEVTAVQVGRAMENAQRFQLERQVVERERRLDALKNEFVSNVSHELRTPLTVIQGLGHTLDRRRDRLDASQRRDLIDRIVSNARRLRTMIDALLDYSRFEADGVRPNLRRVDLGSLVQLAAERLEPLLADRPFGVRTVPVDVMCDPSLLEHVVENLLGNAAKHTPPGTPVELSVTVEDGDVVVNVEDSGDGIAEDELPHLTERFYRGAVQRRQPSPGLGLGLALVHQILEGHGSRLEIGNREEGGARFGFRLPVVS